MRAVFHGELKQLGVELATMCGLAADAMDNASRALLGSDLALAEQVITDDAQLDAAQVRCEEHAFVLLALHRRGLPLDELYRQLSTRSCICWLTYASTPTKGR